MGVSQLLTNFKRVLQHLLLVVGLLRGRCLMKNLRGNAQVVTVLLLLNTTTDHALLIGRYLEGE